MAYAGNYFGATVDIMFDDLETTNNGHRRSKVIADYERTLRVMFLLVPHSNYGSTLHRFGAVRLASLTLRKPIQGHPVMALMTTFD